jgi:hypothetical protein
MPESRAVIEERVRTALDLLMEIPGVEFKRDGIFATYQYDIAKTLMAMANLRDGGMMIFGVSQDGDRRFVFDGITQDSADTFVQEIVADHVNNYASPSVEVCVVPVTHESKLVVAAVVAPFSHTPVVCRRDTPAGATPPLRNGGLYVRMSDPVRTSRIMHAHMMQDLLQLAAGRRAAEIIRMLRDGGVRLEELPFDVIGTAAIAQDPQTVSATGHVDNPEPNRFDTEIEDIDDIL